MTTELTSVRRLAGALALLALTLVGCSHKSTEPVIPPVTVPLSSLTVTPHADTLAVGGQVTLTATALDTLGALVGNPALTWTTHDAAIATVSGGSVSGRGEGQTWIVASGGGRRDSALIVVTGPAGWVLQYTSIGTSSLNGVYFRPEGRLGWAVGSGGRILATGDAGVHWATQPSSTAFDLNGVWFVSDLAGCAVGNAGTVMRTTDGGASWTRDLTIASSENLNDVRFADATHGWAVGNNGVVLRTVDGGAHWAKSYLPVSTALNAVAFSDSLDGWIVGDGGKVFGSHDGGASWYAVASGTTNNLQGVSRWDLDHALAVGPGGWVGVSVAGPDSATWSFSALAGSNNQLARCQLVDPMRGYAAGYNASTSGTILYTGDGGLTWQTQASNISGQLKNVFFVDTQRGWAVGKNGVILHTGTGGFAP